MKMHFIILSILLVFWCTDSKASVLVADNGMSKMIELNADAPFCALYHDRGVIQRMILGADPKRVRQMSTNLVNDLEETCKASRSKGKDQPAGGGLIYPGTKWCGPGSLAASYDDLGHHAAEDACCREHDHCPVTISPQECINGICNNSPFTRSHCDCDAKFRRCLQNLNTEVANTLGALFFNVIQVTCFKERRPCSQWQRIGLEWQRSPRYFSNSQRAWRQTATPVLRTIFDFITGVVRNTFSSPKQRYQSNWIR
ncbi:group 3 secretory phospholipase A2 isoform X2 [Chelonus insularis]|uniref:group 3 secretory phospholipase A2 isoform X2 n=1 Tax=Chelonus insularis TaxID=460826 RepID=UPI0015895E0D|nr:group 3 secretory phospholipase A2 isoform X2 [Chelonus insularis]